jgi:hypothetical protein
MPRTAGLERPHVDFGTIDLVRTSQRGLSNPDAADGVDPLASTGIRCMNDTLVPVLRRRGAAR